MKLSIQELIGKGKLKEAIEALLDATKNKDDIRNQVILFSSRYHGNERENLTGGLSKDNYQQERNRIADGVLKLSQGLNISVEVTIEPEIKENSDDYETILLEIARKNKRRNQQVFEDAEKLLKEVKNWKYQRSLNSLFDPNKRRLREIEGRAKEFVNEVNNSKKDSIEEFTKRIEELLQENVPSYDDLKEAYELSSGRGYENEWIKEQITNRPNDSETRIRIAEKIEAFVASIS